VGDARELDLGDASVDAVLLLGPLYHLRRRQDRVRALAEALRVVRPGGPVFVAAISRWAPRLAGELRLRLYEELPAIREESPRVERTGFIPPLFYQSFTGYCHRPGQLRAELRGAGLEVVDLVAVEGLAFALSDLDERMADPVGRAVVLDAARAIERVPELLGLGPHLLATARRPEGRAAAGPRSGADRDPLVGGGAGVEDPVLADGGPVEAVQGRGEHVVQVGPVRVVGHGNLPSRWLTSAQAGEAGSITAMWSTPASSTSSTGSPAAAAAAA
jgi:hypothetical protein